MTVKGLINGIRIIVESDPDAASRTAAELIARQIAEKTDCVLGLATGGTPVQTYERLIQMNASGEVDFARVTTFNLDEYIGLDRQHSQSYRVFMNTHLFNHINIDLNRTFVPDGCAGDIPRHCAEYESMIQSAGGIDLQLLGLGHNGHIAFNEPGSPVNSRTRQVDLTAETIEKNARFFPTINDVPRHAITMGIATILEAKSILLLALGEAKSDAVDAMLQGPITQSHPASLLRNHNDVTVVLDEAAAGKTSVVDRSAISMD
ncbi:MAG: glucosamine-6-phosphate deaminase [Planctomycetales bacterium]|nr:glucosamine-6-phosphate deaminase [Planctomycetales bacterium]